MNGEGEERRLLRLRGWGRKGGIHGRVVDRGRRRTAPSVETAPADRIAAMRRAAALYLTSRECVARDVAHILLPGQQDATCREAEAAAACGDLMVFTRYGVVMVGFAMAKRRPAAGLSRMAGRIRDLGQKYRIIHAETPAHAVEQLARLIDGLAEGEGG